SPLSALNGHPPLYAISWRKTCQARNLFFFRIDAGHGGIEPSARISPGAGRGGKGDVQALRGLLQSQTAEKSQLDHLGLDRVLDGDQLQTLMQREKLLGLPACLKLVEVGVLPPSSAAMLVATLAACIFDENSAHGLGRGGKKIPTIGPTDVVAACSVFFA